MPKKLEDCVNKITGTNKRTGKPYTRSEKYAICNSMIKKEHEGKAEVDIMTLVENQLEAAKDKLIQSGKAKNREEASMYVDVVLARYEYDLDNLEKII